MITQKLHSKKTLAAALAALALGTAPCALGGITYELRQAVTNAKDVLVSSAGQTVQLELYAKVTGAIGNAALEGFQDGYLSVLSSVSGNIKGDVTAVLAAPFAATLSQNGTSQDLDGDGDKDLGSNLTVSNNDSLFARAATMQTAGIAITNGQEFKLANVTFTITSILNPNDNTPISLSLRVTEFTTPLDIEAVWQEDGVAKNPNPGGGGTFPTVAAPVTIHTIPEPALAACLPLALVAFGLRRFRRSLLA